MTLVPTPHIPLEDYNTWADYWRYDRGLNVIPAISRQKFTYITWKESGHQDNPISEEQHNQWKQEHKFRDGMAVITGKVYHRGRHEGQYFNCIDCDNLKAIEELSTKNGITVSLQDMAKEFVIEQHLDNTNKAHVYFYSTIPIIPKSSSVTQAGITKEMIENNMVPAYEVKSTSKNISFCTPSIHQNGEHYQIIGTIYPIVLDAGSSNSLMQHIDNICERYGLHYLRNANGSSRINRDGLTPMSELLKEDTKILEGGRHMTLMRYAESRIALFYPKLSLPEIKVLVREYNQKHCVPPKSEDDVNKDWKAAVEYMVDEETGEVIQRDDRGNITSKKQQHHHPPTIASTPSTTTPPAADFGGDDIETTAHGSWLTQVTEGIDKEDLNLIQILTDELLKMKTFKTLDDTKQIMHYKDGAYHAGGENVISTTLNKLGGYAVTTSVEREVIAQIIARTMVSRKEFDTDPYLANFKNCIVDLSTGERLEHDPEKYLFTQQLPVTYRPEQVKTPRKILDFLYNVMHPSDVPLVLEFIGYCLIRDARYQKALMIAGPPEMGKSIFLALLTKFLGDENISNKTLQQLTENRFASAALFGKLANIFADLDNSRLKDIGMFKTIVSGDDIDAELKFRNAFSFRPFAKLVFSANLPPLPPQGINDEDAYYRRWLVVPFNLRRNNLFTGKVIIKNPNLLDELTTADEDELSGLAYLAVKSAHRLIAKRKFSKNPSIEQITEEYEKKANPVKAWVSARCVIGYEEEDYETDKERLEADFEEYCQRKKLPAVNRVHLGRELTRLYDCKSLRRGPKNNQVHVWTKIALRKDLIAEGQTDLFTLRDSATGELVEELDE